MGASILSPRSVDRRAQGRPAAGRQATEWPACLSMSRTLLQIWAPGTKLGVGVGSGRDGQGDAGARCATAEVGGHWMVRRLSPPPETGSKPWPRQCRRLCAKGGVLLITDADAPLPAAAEPVASLDPVRASHREATAGVVLIATSARPDQLDARLRSRVVRDRAWSVAARRGHLQSLLEARGFESGSTPTSTKSPPAHRVSSWPTWLRCSRGGAAGSV